MSLTKFQDTRSMQKQIVFLCCNNEESQGEVKKEILFILQTTRIKYLGIILTKEVQDLHIENYKTS